MLPVKEVQGLIDTYKKERKEMVLNELEQLETLEPKTSTEKVCHLVVM